jgi:hypothetical protein
MKHRPTKRLSSLIILTIVQAATVFAGGLPSDPSGWDWSQWNTKLTWKRHITLKKITVSEITGSAASKHKHNLSSIALATANGYGVNPTLDLGSFSATVVRTVQSLWRLRVPSSTSGDDLDVSYEVIGANGHRGCLNNEDRPSSEILVTVHPTAPLVTQRGKHWAFVEGSVVLNLDISSARNAGRYSGTIIVTIHQL